MKLKDFCRIQSGGTPLRSKPEYWENGSIPWVKISDFTGKHISKTEECITDIGLSSSSAKLFAKGTLLYTIFATLGEVAILDIDACTNQAIAGIVVNDDVADKEYLYFYLTSLREQVKNIGRGVAQNNINLSILREIDVPIPVVAEQKRIVKVLNAVDTAINGRKQQMAKLDDLVKSRFVEMFDGKYEAVKLGTVEKTTSGGTPSRSCPEYYENGNIPWLTSGEVNAGIITSVKNHITEAAIENSSAKLVPANSVVVAMYGATAGVTGLLRLNTTTNQAVCSILPSEKFVPEYLYHAVASKKEWLIVK